MPIYEYRCGNGHNFEVLQSMSDEPVSACEECGAPVERVFHPVAVHFKGSGFYTTDYAAKAKAGAAAEGGGGDSGGDSDKGDSGKSAEKSSDKTAPEVSKKSDSSGSGEKTAKAGSGSD